MRLNKDPASLDATQWANETCRIAIDLTGGEVDDAIQTLKETSVPAEKERTANKEHSK